MRGNSFFNGMRELFIPLNPHTLRVKFIYALFLHRQVLRVSAECWFLLLLSTISSIFLCLPCEMFLPSYFTGVNSVNSARDKALIELGSGAD